MNDNDERKWIIGIISDGAKSDYWKLLKKALQEWMKEEHSRLDFYKKHGIKEGESDKYNRAVDRLEYLNKFITINETIVGYHKTFLERVKEKVEDYVYQGESFVREVLRK